MKEKTPFIHLLESPNGKYFFDVNTNEIVPVSEKLYDTLGKSKREEVITLDDDVLKETAELKSRGYLSEHRVKTIRHWASDYLELYMARKIGKITLQITQNCNLRCTYCIYSENANEKQRTHSAKRMSLELAKKGIDFILERSIDSEEINVSFYGGEPLLEFDLIKKIVAYTEEAAAGRSILFNLTTNATLITEEIIKYFIRHEIGIAVSLDGPKEVHDSNRRFKADGSGSFHKVIEKLSWIHENYPDYFEKMVISMVMDPQNNYDYYNSIFKDHEFLKKMILMYSYIDDTYSETKTSVSSQHMEEREYKLFLGFLNNIGRLDTDYIPPLVIKEFNNIEFKKDRFDPTTRLPNQTAPSGPCIPGQSRLFMDVDGNFFPCERVNELSEVMKLGTIEDGISLDKVDALLNIGSLTKEECRNCWAFTQCGLCVKHADDMKELSGEVKLTNCGSMRGRFEEFLYRMIFFREFKEIYQ